MKKKNETLDYENLNDVIMLSKRMLKIFYTCLILAIIFVSILLLRELNILGYLWGAIKAAAPFFIGLVIAWLLDPIVSWLQTKKVKRIVGAIVVFCVFIIILYLFFRLVIPLLYLQINEFVTSLPNLFLSISNWIDSFFNRIADSGIDLSNVETNIYQSIESISTNLTTSLPTMAMNVISSLVSSVGNFLIGLIVGFYLLIDFDRTKHVFDLVPKKYHESLFSILGKLNQTLRSFVQGTLLISLMIIGISAVGYSIIKLPTPLLFAIICGITNIIPYVGPWIGGAICVIVGFTVSPTVGILSAIIAFAVQQIDGIILQPLIMSRTMKLHPVTVMVGLLIFGYFFGVLGMILATPIMSIIKILLNYFDEKYEVTKTIKKKAAVSD